MSLRESPPDFVGAVDKDIDGLRIAWSQDFGFADVHPDVREVTSRAAMAFEELGCSVEETDLAMEEPYDAFGPLHAADSYASMGQYLDTHADLLTDYGRFFLEVGSRVTAKEYARGLGLINVLKVSRAERNQAVWRSKSVPLERRCSAKMSAYDGCRREPLVAARLVEPMRQGNRWLSAW